MLLRPRGIDIPTTCISCESTKEDMEYVLFRYPRVVRAWRLTSPSLFGVTKELSTQIILEGLR